MKLTKITNATTIATIESEEIKPLQNRLIHKPTKAQIKRWRILRADFLSAQLESKITA